MHWAHPTCRLYRSSWGLPRERPLQTLSESTDLYTVLVHSLSQRLLARYFAALLATSGIVSGLVHPLPNLTDMSAEHRATITAVCLLGGIAVWVAPWDRWPRGSLLLLPVIGMGMKMWANLLGGLGPYSYAIHFALIYVWIGVALPRWTALAFAPLLAITYSVPLLLRGDPRQTASVALILPICVVIGESVAWISDRLRAAEQVDGQRMQRMSWLLTASVDLARQQESGELLERVADLATELPAAVGAAVLVPVRGRAFEVAASTNWPGELPARFPLSETPVLIEAMRRGEILGQSDESCAEFGVRLQVPHLGISPLFGSSHCVGVVLLARKSGSTPLDPFTRNLVRTLCVQAGLVIERVRDEEALRDASLHDQLTGLGNRRKAIARLAELEVGDALMAIDLDHFKRVNDTRGHAAGDEVLRKLGSFLARTLREGDEAFRMGGEEFLVVLEQSEEGAHIVGERLCNGWRFQDPLTPFSAGVAVHLRGRSPEATLERADAALYDAKGSGRDKVVVAASKEEAKG